MTKLVLLLLVGCAVAPETVCDDGWDNDGDAIVDCADDDCDGAVGCVEVVCDDGVDNEVDGHADCADPDCDDAPWCVELNCDDNRDNEGDGVVDCLDDDCYREAVCHEFVCDDDYDNDHDGVVDCADDDCVGLVCAEVCDDGRDNDADGLLDCLDSDCAGLPVCLEACDDGRDNDADGLLDCEDGDCAGVCVEVVCGDRADNDFDGDLDCADSDCWGAWGCPQLHVVADRGVAHYTIASHRAIAPWSSATIISHMWMMEGVHGRINVEEVGLSCGFEVDQVDMGWNNSVDYMMGRPTVRQGFRLEPSCPFPIRVEQLPQGLWPDMIQAPRLGDAIYRFGAWTRNSVDSTAPLLPP